jgi:uncharacterized membrane protein
MPDLITLLTLIATFGSGLMSGLLFAFSSFVMRALLRLPAAQGMAAMQHINRLIINPGFLIIFLGATFACVMILVLGWRDSWTGSANVWRVAGALAYLAGPLGVTMIFNVPLNNRLARMTPEVAATEWPRYIKPWLRWNHLRTALGVAATAMLATSLTFT